MEANLRRISPFFVELPIFIAVRAVPLPGVVVAFIGKADGNSGVVKRPEFLD